jgi:hypothetical protein
MMGVRKSILAEAEAEISTFFPSPPGIMPPPRGTCFPPEKALPIKKCNMWSVKLK